jgi:hypothetical protein
VARAHPADREARSAQLARGVSETSYVRARQVLDSGLRALGGSDAFRSVEDISIKFSGRAFEQGQSANPEAQYYVRPQEGRRIIDVRGKRSSFESKTNYLGGSQYWGRQVLNLQVDTIANGHGWIGTMAEFLRHVETPSR